MTMALAIASFRIGQCWLRIGFLSTTIIDEANRLTPPVKNLSHGALFWSRLND
jgi:hypothetical protein